MDAPDRGHSPLGMSVLERRFACPGSMRMEAGRKDQPSVHAQRGTELHAAAAACLRDGVDAATYIPGDDDGVEIVQAYLDEVRRVATETGGELLIESTFTLSGLHELYWGTADAVVVAGTSLWVGDLKTGAGHAVAIRRPDGRVNFQIGGYALGVLDSLPRGKAPIETIDLCVIQPRLGPPSTTRMTLAEIQDLAVDLMEIAEAATVPDAPLSAGEHCSFCRARSDCPELRGRALALAGVEFDVVDMGEPQMPGKQDLPPERLGAVLAQADLIDTWVAGVRDYAKALADKGTTIPGWKLVDRRGRRIWTDEAQAEALLGYLPGATVTKLVSPAQAEKIIKGQKLKLPKEWDDLVTKSDPGTVLVPEHDKRPAVAPRIGKEFQLETEE